MNDSLIIEYESSLQPSLTLEIESAQKRERGISQEGSLRKSRKKYLEEIGFILRKSDNVLGLQSNPE